MQVGPPNDPSLIQAIERERDDLLAVIPNAPGWVAVHEQLVGWLEELNYLRGFYDKEAAREDFRAELRATLDSIWKEDEDLRWFEERFGKRVELETADTRALGFIMRSIESCDTADDFFRTADGRRCVKMFGRERVRQEFEAAKANQRAGEK